MHFMAVTNSFMHYMNYDENDKIFFFDDLYIIWVSYETM